MAINDSYHPWNWNPAASAGVGFEKPIFYGKQYGLEFLEAYMKVTGEDKEAWGSNQKPFYGDIEGDR